MHGVGPFVIESPKRTANGSPPSKLKLRFTPLASNFSSIANKEGYSSIVMSPYFYNQIIKYERKIEENLTKVKSEYGNCYMGNFIIPNFKNWIKNGMKD